MSELSPELETKLAEIIANDVDHLLDEPVKERSLSSEDRLMKGFCEIVDFYRVHGRRPSSATMDITERRLGARLDGLLNDAERAEMLTDLDDFGLLAPEPAPTSVEEFFATVDLSEVFDEDPANDIFDVSALPACTPNMEGVEVAQRQKACDFERFQHLFKAKHDELSCGQAQLRAFSGISDVQEGRFFVLGGVMLLVAELGKSEKIRSGDAYRLKQRLRVIFENGTESSMYRSSLAIALAKDMGRKIVPADYEISSSNLWDAEEPSAHLYVLRSLSTDPQIAEMEHLYKIGFTRTSVAQRIHNAEHDPTYLMAPVEVVADWGLYNVRPSALEHLIHRVFSAVRLEVRQVGADGKNYDPSEWFVVPFEAIDQAVEMVRSGDIVNFTYNPLTCSFDYTPGNGAEQCD